MKIGLHLKLKLGIALLKHQRQWNYLEVLKKITKKKNGEYVPRLEIAEVVLAHCNIANNDYQQDSRVLCSFVPNKPFETFNKTFNSEYNEIEVWFTDQKSKPLEMEDRINLIMVIKWR